MSGRRHPVLRRLAATAIMVIALTTLPTAPAFAASQTVSGTVSFGAEGQHPTGVVATVRWRKVDIGATADGMTTTDANGQYSLSLEPGIYEMSFSAAGYQGQYWKDVTYYSEAQRFRVDASPVTGIDQVLPNYGSISGTAFLGSTSTPAGAGQVRVSYSYCPVTSGCPIWQYTTSTLTTAGGAYSFTGLENGSYRLKFELVSGSTHQPATSNVRLSASSLNPTGLNATLSAAASISGRVTLGASATPAGAGDVKVTARTNPGGSTWYEYPALTDASGNYTIPGLSAGYYKLQFDYVGAGSYADEWYENAMFQSSAQTITLSTAPTIRDANLQAAGAISGRITDSTGAPLGGIWVYATTVDYTTWSTVEVAVVTSASDGTYSIPDLPPAEYGLSFVGSGNQPFVRQVRGGDPLNPQNAGTVVVTSGQTSPNINQVMYRQTMVSGYIKCVRCALQDNYVVFAERNAGTAGSPNWVEAGSSPIYANGYSSGYFDIRSLVPGTYRLVVRGVGGPSPESNRSAEFALVDGQSYRVDPEIRAPSVLPARILETRTGPGLRTIDGLYQGVGAIGPGQTLRIPVLGRAGMPAAGFGAVTLNVTATSPTAFSYLTVFPTGQPRPLASNLNFTPGQTIPNTVIAQVGADGSISIYNHSGSTHVIVDVSGWLPDTAVFTSVPPARLADTRPGERTFDGDVEGVGAIGPGQTLRIPVAGRDGIPYDGSARAVALNLTATSPTDFSYLTVFPTGQTRPLASNLNFTPGQTIPNTVIAQVGDDGSISVYNHSGSTHVIVDIAGWFPDTGLFTAVSPARIADTRGGELTIDRVTQGVGAIGPGQTLRIPVLGRAGIPSSSIDAVTLNVTATNPTAVSYLTVFPTGQPRPLTSNLNFTPGQSIPNTVIAQVGDDGSISIYNNAGNTHVIVDISGWIDD